jgi:hypothetical protein
VSRTRKSIRHRKMETEDCHWTGKVGYRKWDHAATVRQGMELDDPDREFELSIYRCSDCGLLHIGNDHLKPRRRVK